MTKKTTLILAGFVSCLMLFSNLPLNAQQASTKQSNLSKTEIKAKAVKGKQSYVYYKYKGITDLEAAKKEWVKDHPVEYKKSFHQPAAQKVNTGSGKNLDPNKNRRLPKNYDDSKTNISSKN
jgi:hypothetical protein